MRADTPDIEEKVERQKKKNQGRVYSEKEKKNRWASAEKLRDKRAQLLGQAFGSATFLLRKIIIREMAIKLGVGKCFRCGEDISLEQFSIDHKSAWMAEPDPALAFFDLNNIAFSHMTCNIKSASRPNRKYASFKEMKRETQRIARADPVRRAAMNANKRRLRLLKKQRENSSELGA